MRFLNWNFFEEHAWRIWFEHEGYGNSLAFDCNFLIALISKPYVVMIFEMLWFCVCRSGAKIGDEETGKRSSFECVPEPTTTRNLVGKGNVFGPEIKVLFSGGFSIFSASS